MRRKPFGAIVAWGSLALFAVLTILGIAGVVMGLQQVPTSSAEIQVAAAPEPAPVEARLPEETSFAEVAAADAEVVQVAEAATVAPEAQVAVKRDDMIASTFDQLVEPVVVPANKVPERAVATVAVPAEAVPAETVVASPEVVLPMSRDGAAQLSAHPRAPVARNAAAWAIESEVPDADGNRSTALGYAAQPKDDGVHVGDSSVNVRSGPAQGNKKLFALAAGAEVAVVGKAGGWVSITDERGRDGWVDATLLENVDLTDVPNAKNVPAAEPEKPSNLKIVGGSGVTVRAGPGKSNKQLFALSNGEKVTVIDNSKGWLKVKDAKGRTGWAYQNYLK
jgi:uncharacterized protein YgiM (DUF1202 family)